MKVSAPLNQPENLTKLEMVHTSCKLRILEVYNASFLLKNIS